MKEKSILGLIVTAIFTIATIWDVFKKSEKYKREREMYKKSYQKF